MRRSREETTRPFLPQPSPLPGAWAGTLPFHATSVMLKALILHGLILLFVLPRSCRPMPTISDQSVKAYLTERTCWWNEICKEEFQNQFKCKCPMWSYCRSEGRYYSAYCSMTNTGYIWTQPERTWSIPIQHRSALAPTS